MRDYLVSVGKGALVAALGAAIAYVAAYVNSPEGSADLGVWGPLAAAGLAVAVNALRKAGGAAAAAVAGAAEKKEGEAGE